MSSDDVEIAHYHALRPADFHYLERLEIRQSRHLHLYQTSIEIELRPKDDSDDRRLVLSFDGVRNLRYVPAETSVLFFGLIEIVSVRYSEWEGINYKVFESEQDTELSFLCREFTAI